MDFKLVRQMDDRFLLSVKGGGVPRIWSPICFNGQKMLVLDVIGNKNHPYILTEVSSKIGGKGKNGRKGKKNRIKG